MPIIAVVDPDMMSSMPKGLTASTGMDALTHAIEGYTTKAAWEMTDMFHLKAIEIISKFLRNAVANTKEGREGMALGQYIAGMGFSNVGLGIAHSMAHTLGAVYDTPHGVACAMMLPIVMEYNADCTGEKYREIARAMGVPAGKEQNPEESIKAAVKYIAATDRSFNMIPDKQERLNFILASYNAGLGHIYDAMALAKKYGKNNLVWKDNVENFILLKSNEEYFTDPVCKNGYFRGIETFNFVRDIQSRFESYKKKIK